MSYKVGQEYQHVIRNSDGKLVSLPGRDSTLSPFANLILLARAVAQCQMDNTGLKLLICMARFGPSGIGRMNAANMLSALTSAHPNGAMATAVRHNERETNLWRNEQLANEAEALRKREARIVTVRNLKGKVIRYEVEMVKPAFKLVTTPEGPRTWGIEERTTIKFKTKKAALAHVA